MAAISRAQMEAAINNGGCVILNGAIITRIEDLPSEADLAKTSGDTDQIDAAKAALEAKVKELQAAIDALQGPMPARVLQQAAAPAKVEATVAPSPPAGGSSVVTVGPKGK